MKAFLLAAGLGTRLRPLTDEIPKCLLPIGGKPLLQIWLEHLARHHVDQVLINSHHHAKKVADFVRGFNGSPRIRLEYEPVLLGSGGTIWSNRDFMEREEEFWVIYGDNLSSVDLSEMLATHQRYTGLATIGLFQTEKPTECGIAFLDQTNRIMAFEEKPAQPKGNLANAGIYLLKREIFEKVRWDFPLPTDFGYHILQQLVGKMYGYVINEYHLDIGTPENYERAQREFLGSLVNQQGQC